MLADILFLWLVGEGFDAAQVRSLDDRVFFCRDCVGYDQLRVNGQVWLTLQSSGVVQAGKLGGLEAWASFDPACPSFFDDLLRWVMSMLCNLVFESFLSYLTGLGYFVQRLDRDRTTFSISRSVVATLDRSTWRAVIVDNDDYWALMDYRQGHAITVDFAAPGAIEIVEEWLREHT